MPRESQKTGPRGPQATCGYETVTGPMVADPEPEMPPTPDLDDPEGLGPEFARAVVALGYLLVGLVVLALIVGLVLVATDVAKFPWLGG